MPKYANIQRCPQNSRQSVVEGIGKGLSNFLDTYNQKKQKELEEKNDQEVIQQLDNPDLSPVAKAGLAAKLSTRGQKALMDMMKLEDRFARQSDVTSRADQEREFKEGREKRLDTQNAVKDLQRLYQNKLMSIKDQIKDTFRENDKKPLRDQQSALQKELGLNLKRLREGKKPEFRHLEVEEAAAPTQLAQLPSMNQMGGMPQGQMQQTPQAYPQPQAAQPARQKWNPQDPRHVAMAQEAVQAAGGDRQKANAMLSELFER